MKLDTITIITTRVVNKTTPKNMEPYYKQGIFAILPKP